MKCEHCGRVIREGDTIHATKYGTLTCTGFKAAQESAVVVICEPCGARVSQYMYSTLDPRAFTYPTIFKLVTDLTTLMKNGYKLIQRIASLPVSDQRALHHLVNSCKQTK
ncbi:hypothetical protein L4X63_23075 [Geomonas sp. Red32]|uniref:hypothetical protein n=1 Tax=Geomonas sp. Red32 TaxID=2912856 RepID=UPI00202CCC9C|nr:hypothetical protein [Geomonas sp. Red32]MCM0084465.1 hypothetical protein [Geomonas sp. Red32]